jgi:hypothetical protein
MYYLLIENKRSDYLYEEDYFVKQITDQSTSTFFEFEPNDNTENSTVIDSSSEVFQGQLSSFSDKDYYSFTSSGGVVQFNISSVPNPNSGFTIVGSLKASIVDKIGNILSTIEVQEFDTTGVVLSANTTEGMYYLLIENKRSDYLYEEDYFVTLLNL